jgi:hypothetical protein
LNSPQSHPREKEGEDARLIQGLHEFREIGEADVLPVSAESKFLEAPCFAVCDVWLRSRQSNYAMLQPPMAHNPAAKSKVKEAFDSEESARNDENATIGQVMTGECPGM